MPVSTPELSVDARLAGLDRDQLLVIVWRLLHHQPDLEELVHLPLPGERRGADRNHIRAMVGFVLSSMGDDWRASARARSELRPLVELGSQYLDQGEVEEARVVFVTLADSILSRYERIWDAESEVAEIVALCVEGLGRCLLRAADEATRVAVLREIFAIYRWDALDSGGYGMEDAPRKILIEATTPAERSRVAGWVREALSQGSTRYGRWSRQRAGRFVLDLVGTRLEPAELERLFTETDLDAARMDLLLNQGRTSEAIQLLRDAEGDSLTRLADRLIAAGLGDKARAVVRDHLSALEPANQSTREWLVAQGVALSDDIEDLVEAIRSFQLRKTITTYQELKLQALTARRWPEVLALVGVLDPHLKNLQPVRARVKAELGDVAGSLAELDGLTGGTWNSAAREVARSLETTHPDVALELYHRLVQVLRAHGTKAAMDQVSDLERHLENLERERGGRVSAPPGALEITE